MSQSNTYTYHKIQDSTKGMAIFKVLTITLFSILLLGMMSSFVYADADSDGDGVFDSVDLCRYSPVEEGDIDSDGDGCKASVDANDSDNNVGKASVFTGGGLQKGLDAIDEDARSDLGIIESGSIIDTIFFLIRYALIIAGIAAFVAFIWSGLLYVTSFINEDNNETAKKAMINSAIGIVLILLSYAIVSFLITLQL